MNLQLIHVYETFINIIQYQSYYTITVKSKINFYKIQKLSLETETT